MSLLFIPSWSLNIILLNHELGICQIALAVILLHLVTSSPCSMWPKPPILFIVVWLYSSPCCYSTCESPTLSFSSFDITQYFKQRKAFEFDSHSWYWCWHTDYRHHLFAYCLFMHVQSR